MKRGILFCMCTLFPMVAGADYLDDKIATLTQQKLNKIAELEKCQKSTKGLKIAGITTLGVSTIGIAANIGEAVALNKTEDKIETAQKTSSDLDSQIAAAREEARKKAEEEAKKKAEEEKEEKKAEEEVKSSEIESDTNIPDCPATGSCSINDCKSDAVLRGLGAASADCYDGACIATECSDPSGNHTKKQCKKTDGTIFSYYSTCIGKGQSKNTDKCELTGHINSNPGVCACAEYAYQIPGSNECKCQGGTDWKEDKKECEWLNITVEAEGVSRPDGPTAAEVAAGLPRGQMTVGTTNLIGINLPETELQKSLNEVNAQSNAQKAELQRRLQAGQLTQGQYDEAVNLLDANTESQRAEMTKKAQEELQEKQRKSWEKTAEELNKIDASIKKAEAKEAEEAKKKLCEDTNGRWRPGRKDCECDDIYSFVDGQGCVLDQAKKQAQLEELTKKQDKLTESKVDKKTERQTDKLLKDLQKQQEEAAEKAKQALCEKAGRWNPTLKRCNCNDDLHKWDDAMGCVVDEAKMRKEVEKQAEKQRKADEQARKQAEEDAYDKRVSDAMAEYGLSKSKAKQYIENQDKINALNSL